MALSNYRGVFVAALAAARHNIYIENPLFSDPLIARMLIRKAREFRARVVCEARDSYECAMHMRDAVQIYLVLPDSSDKPLVDAIGTADFNEMLHLGIKVHRWRPELGWSASSMLHSKVWLIDYEPGRGGLAYVSAANATQRSHIADNEAGLLSPTSLASCNRSTKGSFSPTSRRTRAWSPVKRSTSRDRRAPPFARAGGPGACW